MYKYSLWLIYNILFYIKFIFSIEYLKKYEKIEINCTTNNFIIFNSSDFNIPSTIYFIFSTNSTLSKEISFEFFDLFDNFDTEKLNNLRFGAFPSSESYEMNNSYYYYKILKDSNHIKENVGKYIIFSFECYGIIRIENTINDSSPSKKISTGILIAICGGCVGVIGLIIGGIYFCYKCKNIPNKKKEKTRKVRKRRKKKKSLTKKNIINPIIYSSQQQMKLDRRRSQPLFPVTSGSSITIKK